VKNCRKETGSKPEVCQKACKTCKCIDSVMGEKGMRMIVLRFPCGTCSEGVGEGGGKIEGAKLGKNRRRDRVSACPAVGRGLGTEGGRRGRGSVVLGQTWGSLGRSNTSARLLGRP